jgi:HK97 family phage major capsid protein
MSDLETQTKTALDAIQSSLKEANERTQHELKNQGSMNESTKKSVDELMIKLNETTAELKAVELKLSEQKTAQQAYVKTYGEQFVQSEGFKSFVSRGAQDNVKVSLKAITVANAGGMAARTTEAEVVGMPRRALTIRDLLTVVPLGTSTVEYTKQSVRTNNAAPVAEGASKPYSIYEYLPQTIVAKALAHLAKVTRQAMDDAPRLQAEINGEMTYGLKLLEEAQILYGSGTGENLHGIIPQATAYLAPITIAGATNIDVLRLAALQAAIGNYPADGIALSMADWAKIELTKETSGAYIFANPQGIATPSMWGLPVVASSAMTTGQFLVGSFKFGATLYDRMAIEVMIANQNADDFEKNLLTLRVEERLALAVKRPASFITGTFA